MKEKQLYDLSEGVFVLSRSSFYWKALADSSLRIFYPYYGEKNLLLRKLRQVHFRFIFPFKRIWYNYVEGRYRFIFIFEETIIPEYIEWLHERCPSAVLIMFYVNNCSSFSNPQKFQYDYLKLWSGDENDCQKYNLRQCPYMGGYWKGWKVEKTKPEIDVFFVGKDKDKKRREYLCYLNKCFRKLGLKTYFHLVGEKRYEKLWKPYYKSFMPYDDCLKYLGKTKSILYLGYGSQECVTVRILESLVHKIKLITDCTWIKKYDFYNRNNIFILNEDDFDRLQSFLDTPYIDIQSELFNHIYMEDMFNEIVRLSINNN